MKWIREILANTGVHDNAPTIIKMCDNCGEYPVSRVNYNECKRCKD